MATVTAAELLETVRLDHWALNVQHTFGGADTNLTLPCSILRTIPSVHRDIMIDGMSVRHVRAGGGGGVQVIPYIYAALLGTGTQHYLTEFTTGGDTGTHIYPDLNIATAIYPDRNLAAMMATYANLDVASFSLWGRFLPSEVSAPTPVAVQSFRLWPKPVNTEQL